MLENTGTCGLFSCPSKIGQKKAKMHLNLSATAYTVAHNFEGQKWAFLGPKFTPLEPVLNGLQEPKKRPRCHHRGPNRRNMEMIYVFNFSLSMFHTAQIAAESAAATTGASTFHAEDMSGGNPLLSMMHTSGTSTPKKL